MSNYNNMLSCISYIQFNIDYRVFHIERSFLIYNERFDVSILGPASAEHPLEQKTIRFFSKV